MTPKLKPGYKFIRTHPADITEKYLVVLLSSDMDPGWETSEPIWRCAQFQIGSVTELLGAQIVLYTESEIAAMEPDGVLTPEFRVDQNGKGKMNFEIERSPLIIHRVTDKENGEQGPQGLWCGQEVVPVTGEGLTRRDDQVTCKGCLRAIHIRSGSVRIRELLGT